MLEANLAHRTIEAGKQLSQAEHKSKPAGGWGRRTHKCMPGWADPASPLSNIVLTGGPYIELHVRNVIHPPNFRGTSKAPGEGGEGKHRE
jgi:hypothetical protein